MSTYNKVKEDLTQYTYERALLCYALNSIDNFYTISSKLADTDFLHSNNAIMYNALRSLHSKGHEIFDIPVVMKELDESGDLKEIGGIKMLNAIKNMPVTSGTFDKALSNVLDASTKFRLYRELNEHVESIILNTNEGSLTSNDLISKVENSVLTLSTQSRAIAEPRNLAEGLREYIEEKRKNKVEMTGVRTGFPILDNQLDGLVPRTLTIIAARKKMGKSAFLSTIAAHVAFVEKKPTLYVDTEMSFVEWRDRLISFMSKVPERVIKHGGYNDQDYAKIQVAIKTIEKGKLFHEYMPGYSVDKIVALYKKYYIKENIGLAVFDYIKEPDSSSIERNRKEHQVLGDVTTKLKDLAGTLNIPFLTAVQLNRDGDVADSDRVARYGDVVAHWMTRTKDELERSLEAGGHKLIIRDTRRGGATPEEGIGYKFQKDILTIREIRVDKQLVNYGQGVINNDNDELQ